MAARPVLVVAVVRDAEIRGALARCLAMHGVDLITASKWDARLFGGPTIRPQSFLVVDAAAARHARAIERQQREGRWSRVVTLPAGSARTLPAELLSALFANGTGPAA